MTKMERIIKHLAGGGYITHRNCRNPLYRYGLYTGNQTLEEVLTDHEFSRIYQLLFKDGERWMISHKALEDPKASGVKSKSILKIIKNYMSYA